VIITPFASDLPAFLSGLCRSQRFLHLLEHEIEGQTRLPELLTALAPEAQTNRRRTTRFRGFGIPVVDSHSGQPQRVRPAVEAL
jgi:hypothetical protein